MSNLWRIRAWFWRLKRAEWRRKFERHCQQVSDGLLVKGPLRVRNAGRIEVGAGCIFDSSCESPIQLDVGKSALLTIGDDVYFNEGVHIVCNIAVSIGARCLIASDVVILDDDGHPVDWHERHHHWPVAPEDRLGAPIVIEENVWVGTRAIILKGVHIGNGAVIGAGAVVTRDIPPMTVAAGVPARVIRRME